MIRKVKITKIFQSNKDKEGNPLVGKFGPYYKIGIATEEYPTKYINGFGKTELSWKIGDEVEIDLEEKGEYLNFKLPKKEDVAIGKVEDLSKDMADLRKALKALEARYDDKLFDLESKLMLELGGKAMTKATLDKSEANTDFVKKTVLDDGIPLDAYADEIPF